MDLYDSKTMPLSSDPAKRKIQEKIKNGEQLTFMEKINAGRDTAIKEFNGYQFKSDHVYRVISEDALRVYKEKGFIIGFGDDDEYKEYELIKQKNEMLLKQQQELQQTNGLSMKLTNGFANIILLSILTFIFAILIGFVIFKFIN